MTIPCPKCHGTREMDYEWFSGRDDQCRHFGKAKCDRCRDGFVDEDELEEEQEHD